MTFLFIFFLLLALLFSGFLSASETALFSLSPLSLRSYRNSKDLRLALIAHLMERPREILVTLLILNVFSNLLVQNIVSDLFGMQSSWILKVGCPLLLTLFIGEVLPKSVALPNNASVAYHVAPFISKVARILKPIRNPLTDVTSWISRIVFFFLREEKKTSLEELAHLLDVSQQSGILGAQEVHLIRGALNLQSALVKEKMRPREEILFYKLSDPLTHLARFFIDYEISRLPICEGSLENLKGILLIQDFFFHQQQITDTQTLLTFLKKPYFVPETTKAWTLLKHLREKQEDLAMVVDEYGSVAGLITQEDLIEAVIGEIKDRRDEPQLYIRSSEDVIIASGKLELSEFKSIFGISLESKQNAVTLGGWLIEQFQDIPVSGTKYATDQFIFYILAADPNRIVKVYVRKILRKHK